MNGVNYTWDANGNLLNDGTNAYVYDSANRLKSMSNQSTVSSYQYTGLGDRISQTVNGQPTNYTLDLNTGLTQVLNDGTNTYTYGLGRISQTNTVTEYFLSDALGSVRQLTNNAGVITYTKAYDPYGVVTSTSGASQSTYGYTGEQQSNNMVYLRSRYYASNTGRFISRDMWGGDANSPLSFNRWNYTNANPINWIDPSGRISENDNIQALIITETLQIDYNVKIAVDWGYMKWLPGIIYGIPAPNFHCNEWQYGNWRTLDELKWVSNGVQRLAAKMGGPAKFKAAMKNRLVEIVRVKTLPPKFEDNTGLALPYYPLYFMVKGLMLPDSPFDIGELRTTYTTIHELGHVWDIRSNLSLSINMALHLGNTKHGNDALFDCLLAPADPTLRFACAMIDNWKYDGVNNEPAPGDLTDPYAHFSLAEDWAEAVAYTTYPEYGQRMNYREVGPIRKIYVEMMMRDIH